MIIIPESKVKSGLMLGILAKQLRGSQISREYFPGKAHFNQRRPGRATANSSVMADSFW